MRCSNWKALKPCCESWAECVRRAWQPSSETAQLGAATTILECSWLLAHPNLFWIDSACMWEASTRKSRSKTLASWRTQARRTVSEPGAAHAMAIELRYAPSKQHCDRALMLQLVKMPVCCLAPSSRMGFIFPTHWRSFWYADFYFVRFESINKKGDDGYPLQAFSARFTLSSLNRRPFILGQC